MKKIQVAFAALAAVAGIGGAYATTHASSTVVGTVFNWYNASGFVFSGTIKAGTAVCHGGGNFCLRGTAPGQVVTLFTAAK